MKEGQAHSLKVREEVITEVELDVAGHPDDEAAHPKAEDPVHQRYSDDKGRVEDELLLSHRDREIVDRHPEHLGCEYRCHLAEEQADHSERQPLLNGDPDTE